MRLNSSHRGTLRTGAARPRPGLAIAAASLGLLLGTASAVHAENDRNSAAQFFSQESERATQLPSPAAQFPSSGAQSASPAARLRIHHAAPTFRRVLMQRAATEHRPRALAPSAPPTPSTSVVVYGDRLGQALASGLQEGGGGALGVSALTSEEAGLTRQDFDAWLQSVRDRMAKPDHAAIAAIMIGSNDWQALPDGKTTVTPETARWQELYGARVDAVAKAFRDARVPLIWVGLPSVHNEETSAEFVRLNAIFRDRAAKDGATYVDSWEAFSDDAGRYSPVGPDVEGQTVKLRKADGFGFTRAGARKLASFVEGDIKRLHTPGGRPSVPEITSITIDKARDFDQALDIDVNAQIRREAGLTPEATSAAGRPAEPAKAAAGPVLPLTAPPLSPDGHLASASDAPPGTANSMQANLVVKPLGDGAPISPKPGRADDFSWPRP